MSGPLLLALRLGLAVALYAFLGWAFWTLARDLHLQSRQLADRRIPPIRIRIESAGQPAQERAFALSEVLIGRDPACGIVLDDPTVSNRHARLRYHHGQWWLEDLGSTNGTRLNDEPVQTATVLTAGDRIECGAQVLIVHLPAAIPTPTIPRPKMEG